MKKSLFLVSLVVVAASVLGIENFSNSGSCSSPFPSPKQDGASVDCTATPKLTPDQNLLLSNLDSSINLGAVVQEFLNGELDDKHTKNLVLSLVNKVISQELLLNQMLLQQLIGHEQTSLNFFQNIPSIGMQNADIFFNSNQNAFNGMQTLQELLNPLNTVNTSASQEISSAETFIPVRSDNLQQEDSFFSSDFSDKIDLDFNSLNNTSSNAENELFPSLEGSVPVAATEYGAWNYLKLIDKKLRGQSGWRENKRSSILSFFKYKLSEYEKSAENEGRKINLRSKKNEVRESVKKYFGIHPRVMSRLLEPYRGNSKKVRNLKITNEKEYIRIMKEKTEKYNLIPAIDIETEVNEKIEKYKRKYNILDALNDVRSENVKNKKARENISESKKIIRYLWKTGFGYNRIIELLGIKDDFETNYLHTAGKQSTNDLADSSASKFRTKKRKADQNNESSSYKKQNKGKQSAED